MLKQIEVWKNGELWANVAPYSWDVISLTGVPWRVKTLIREFINGGQIMSTYHNAVWRWGWK